MVCRLYPQKHQVKVVCTPTHKPGKMVSYLRFLTFRPYNNTNAAAENSKKKEFNVQATGGKRHCNLRTAFLAYNLPGAHTIS